jgi:hypothetical protein
LSWSWSWSSLLCSALRGFCSVSSSVMGFFVFVVRFFK